MSTPTPSRANDRYSLRVSFIGLLTLGPSQTRITTKYSIKPVKARKPKAGEDAPEADTPMTDVKPPRGRLILKTYDPSSGVTLKYRTTKAAEVSRLILALGRLGRAMAALPDVKEEEVVDVPVKEEEGEVKTGAAQQAQAPAPAAGGGGGKKKKKGKK